MTLVGGRHVEAAVGEMTEVLTPHVEADWSLNAGSLEWSCWETAAHVAHDLVAYAGQVAGGATVSYLTSDLVVAPSPLKRCSRSSWHVADFSAAPSATLGLKRGHGIGECPIRQASLRWASRKPSYTLTTSRRAWA